VAGGKGPKHEKKNARLFRFFAFGKAFGFGMNRP